MKYTELLTSKELIPLAGGLTNQCFLFHSTEGKWVLRLNGDAAKLGIDRDTEYRIHSLLSEHQLAPKIHYVAPDNSYWVRDFVEGAALSQEDFSKQNILLMLAHLKKVHQIPVPFPINPISIYDKANNYWNKIEQQYQFKELQQQKQTLQAFFEAHSSPAHCLCHMDPTPANWIKKPNAELVLLDWEYAGFGNPLWDVAGLFQETKLTLEQELALLARYGSFTQQEWLLAKAELKYLEVLWYAVQQLTSPQHLVLQLDLLLCSLSSLH